MVEKIIGVGLDIALLYVKQITKLCLQGKKTKGETSC